MENENKINLKYRFEKAPITKRPLSNPIERFGTLASQVVQISPTLIPHLAFGRSEYISGGEIDPGLMVPQPKIDKPPENIRIRCIEDASGPLIEYYYDNSGRISEVVLFNSFREKYTWSDDGKLLSVLGLNSEQTQFKYQKEGLLSFISYPNGSVFRYEYDQFNRLIAIVYPDGVSVKYNRNDQGLLTRSECIDCVFEYLWNKDNLLQEIQYHDKIGSWKQNLQGLKNQANLKFQSSSSSTTRSLSSVLGNWRYNKDGLLTEMIITGGERYKQRGDEESGVELWTHSGQTYYHFDKSKALMRMINTDGTTNAFRRYKDQRIVLLASLNGISMLHYNEQGILQSERVQQAKGISYKFDKHKMLQQINIDESIIKINWNETGKIKDFSINDDLKCTFKNVSDFPEKITIKTSPAGYMESTETVIGFIWNWEAMKLVRRFNDPNF